MVTAAADGDGGVALSSSRSPEDVIMSRHGSVLGKKTVLKSDHFPGCHNKKIRPFVEGAPNFRKISRTAVYGVAIPTVDGIRNVLHMVGASREDAGRKVLWHNMREEPVVYINGRPFVLREVERPFRNLEYTGIDRERVEAMEARLKEDILQEAARYSNKIMVSDELDNGQMVDMWEPVSREMVQTPLEVYQSFQSEGYAVLYQRVPVTDEKSPKERDFDLLVSNLTSADEATAQIFNCQMGRGRTTTGTVVATLLALQRWPQSKLNEDAETVHSAPGASGSGAGDAEAIDPVEQSLRSGEYAVIRSLVRVLDHGVESKRLVDAVIDRCSAMQNLREAIVGYRNSIHKEADERKREAALANFVEYLERYYFLICFAAFLHNKGEALDSLAPKTAFQNWMKARPELYSILRRLLRRDPMGALAYRRSQGAPEAEQTLVSSSQADRAEDEMMTVVQSREGAVLGRQTMLKADHCPGCQSSDLPERIEGAPNFRAIPGFRVYGVAAPTADGIRSVLGRIGASKGGAGRKVVWHNMREEATVYINGCPFVLREVERPYKNMKEYSGIDKTRVEAMEARLKEDVVAEARRNAGAVVVSQESEDGAVFHALERVLPGNDFAADPAVHTPLEIFQMLQREGYDVEYERLPITDGRAPKSRDLDAMAERIGACDPDTAFVFNCQMGRGRTTTGTVVATLVLVRCLYGQPLSVPPSLQSTHASPPPPQPSSSMPAQGHSAAEPNGADKGRGAEEKRAEKRRRTSEAEPPSEDDLFQMEDIAAVRRVMRQLELGASSKKVLDAVVDACDMMQNIREAVLRYRQIFNEQNESSRVRQGALSRGVEYLERYITLIAYTAYLNTPNFVPSGTRWPESRLAPPADGPTLSFKDWMRHRPDIRQIRISMRLRPARVFSIPEDDVPRTKSGLDAEDKDAVMEAVVRTRCGSVLSRSSILKQYHFPGLKVQQLSHGAFDSGRRRRAKDGQAEEDSPEQVPNFFQVMGFPVCSMATPTISGAEAAVESLLATSLSGEGSSSRAVPTQSCEVRIMDLREEAVVYIRGQPYVLRDMATPQGPLKHFGIQGPLVELMEQRLKAELLEEAERMGGRVLLHREEEEEAEGEGGQGQQTEGEKAPSPKSQVAAHLRSASKNFRPSKEAAGNVDLIGFWKHVSVEDVMTPAEVYREMLPLRRGFNVRYTRIPLTRERVPQTGDVDKIQRCMDGAKPCVKYLFVSHTGYGAIAYAMAVAALRLTAHATASSAEPSYLEACSQCQPGAAKEEQAAGPSGEELSAAIAAASGDASANAAASANGADSESRRPPFPQNLSLDVATDVPVQRSLKGVRTPPQLLSPAANSPAKPPVIGAMARAPQINGGSSGSSSVAGTNLAELGLRQGEYRSVLSLERLLVHGPACKRDVDALAALLLPVGDIVGDILEYKKLTQLVQGDSPLQKEQRALLQEMGTKALQRYCYLIVFRAYLFSQIAKKGHTAMEEDSFEKWVALRPEITHLLSRLSLD